VGCNSPAGTTASGVAFLLPRAVRSVGPRSNHRAAERLMRIGAVCLAAMMWVPAALAGGAEDMREFSFTPETFRTEFDRQAGRDETDSIAQCVEG
jgi:hypothetical protein